jgi:hypothetical protein
MAVTNVEMELSESRISTGRAGVVKMPFNFAHSVGGRMGRPAAQPWARRVGVTPIESA